MYIRKKIVHSKRTGISYAYYQLLESRNTEKGPRNTVLLHLGLPEDKAAQIYTLLNVKVAKNQVITKHQV